MDIRWRGGKDRAGPGERPIWADERCPCRKDSEEEAEVEEMGDGEEQAEY